jgi:hypothetical protein
MLDRARFCLKHRVATVALADIRFKHVGICDRLVAAQSAIRIVRRHSRLSTHVFRRRCGPIANEMCVSVDRFVIEARWTIA